MTKRLLDHDTFTNISTWFDYNELTDETTISYTGGDVEAHVEASKALANDEGYTRKGMKNEMLHYAHIPDMVLMQWHTMGVDISNKRALIEMVNRPEWRYLKTTDLKHMVKA